MTHGQKYNTEKQILESRETREILTNTELDVFSISQDIKTHLHHE